MSSLPAINEFLSQPVWAIAGVSRDKKKFGSYLYLTLKKRGRKVVPVNPNMADFDGDVCYNSLDKLPAEISGVIICTPPAVSKGLVSDAIAHGIRQVWLQQGAENNEVLEAFRDSGINLVSGKCILMYAEPVDSFHGFHRFIAKLFGRFGK